MFATLVNQVRAITGSTTGETSTVDVQDFIKHGIRHVLSTLPVELSFPFSVDSTIATSSTPISLDTNKLLSVERNSIECVQVPESLGYEIGDTNSLHLATVRYPAFYLSGNQIYIKPNPTTAATAKAKIIDIVAKTTSVSTALTSVLGQYDNVVVKYAAYLDANASAAYLLRKGSSQLTAILAKVSSSLTQFTTSLPTYTSETFTVSTDIISSALASAKTLISGTATTYITDEDTEMIASAVQTAKQELDRAQTAIQNELMEIKDFDSKVGQKIQQFKLELDAAMSYIQEASVRIQEAQAAKGYQEQADIYLAMARSLYKECQYIMNNYIGAKSEPSGSDGESRQ